MATTTYCGHALRAEVEWNRQRDWVGRCVVTGPAFNGAVRLDAPLRTLREFARFAIRDRKLPRRDPARVWGGPGGGAVCGVCEKPITRDQQEYELEFPPDSGNPGLDKLHFHLRCFAAWELERTKIPQ